jgi:raffinose/stachyose/melibiose transport system substrate-binding protein
MMNFKTTIYEATQMRLLKTIAVVTTAAALAATASAADTVVKLAGWRKQEIPLWDRVNSEDLIPGVEVEYTLIDPNDYEARLNVSLQQGSVDVFTAKTAQIPALYKSEQFAALPASFDLSLVESNTAITTLDGQTWGIPFAIQLQSLQYDKAVFEEYGFELPTNLEEFEALLVAADDEGLVPMYMALGTGWYNNQTLNEIVVTGLVADDFAKELAAGTACFTDAPFVDAMNTFFSWQPYFNEESEGAGYSDPRVPFALGEALFKADGAWVTAPVGAEFQANPFIDWGFAAIPGAGGKVSAHADGGYFVSPDASNTNAAFKVLQFTATTAYAEILIEEIGDVPAVAGDYSAIADETTQKKIDALENASAVNLFSDKNLNNGSPSYQSLMGDFYTDVAAGDVTVEEAVQDLQAKLNGWGYVGAAKCAQ